MDLLPQILIFLLPCRNTRLLDWGFVFFMDTVLAIEDSFFTDSKGSTIKLQLTATHSVRPEQPGRALSSKEAKKKQLLDVKT